METHVGTDELNGASPRTEPAKTIGIGQFRSHMCDYVHRVATGESFTVVRRGRPVAVIHWVEEYGPIRPLASIQSMGHGSGVPVEVSHLRSCAGRYLDRVETGERLDVMHRGNRVARIVAAPTLGSTTKPKRRYPMSHSAKV